MVDEDKVKKEPKKTTKSDPIASQANHNQTKVKKKQGPKVVNFVGQTHNGENFDCKRENTLKF